MRLYYVCVVLQGQLAQSKVKNVFLNNNQVAASLRVECVKYLI